MLKNSTPLSVVCFVFFSCITYLQAQSTATIREFDTVFMSYPFSDPNPIPRTGKIYPYFTFDGYSHQAEPRSWKMVELENEFIRVQITPEIGGKIWSAYDKTRNTPFIYGNDVVKFRNIAMRGPWTSGGIEFNFGIIGHTPTVSIPIDYLKKQNNDGSVSCFISALDLLSRSRWIVEINLPADKARFSTHVYWINSTDLEQPYYTWMNLAVPIREDLHFVDPGTHYITHGGESHPWPIDTVRKIDLSVYKNNAFEGSKSYHITGKHTDFFGTYYENTNDGMIHLADRDDKPGKKVFLWALSDAGQIWEHLLSDSAGLYAEVQSGRLYNQNAQHSSQTPFKQPGFPPLRTNEWTEYWFPYHGIGSVDFVDKNGVWHFDRSELQLGIDLMSLSPVNDTVKIYTPDGFLAGHPLDLTPLKPTHLLFQVKPDRVTKITFGSTQIIPDWIESRKLSRPLSIPDQFDQEGGYNQYLMGHDAAGFRQYEKAEDYIRNSLAKDSFFIPALTEMAILQYRKMHYDSAFYFASRAMSINTYDPDANYYYGLAADQLGQTYDALDGWEIAALSPSRRIAAWYQIAASYFRSQNWSRCQDYIDKILELQPSHPPSVKMQIALNRVQDNSIHENLIDRITSEDPGNHFIAYEKYLRSRKRTDEEAFQAAIRNELPDQTYLELAIWYATKLNRVEDAVQLLEMAPPNNLIDYWLAYLTRKDDQENNFLTKANQGHAEFISPFRRETFPMLQWAIANSEDWKPRYYLSLLLAHTGDREMAAEILKGLSDDIDFAPLYTWRSSFQTRSEMKEKSLRTALSIKPDSWRHVMNLADFLLKHDRLDEAQKLLAPFYHSHPSNYQIGMTLSRLYIMAGEPHKSDEILRQIQVLPYEGAREGRVMYQSVKLLQALNSLSHGQYDKAAEFVEESKLWPENLGVGKPYENRIDTTWEDKIAAWIHKGSSGHDIPSDKIASLRDKIKSRFFEFKETAPF